MTDSADSLCVAEGEEGGGTGIGEGGGGRLTNKA